MFYSHLHRSDYKAEEYGDSFLSGEMQGQFDYLPQRLSDKVYGPEGVQKTRDLKLVYSILEQELPRLPRRLVIDLIELVVDEKSGV
jgi:hypothetical protein